MAKDKDTGDIVYKKKRGFGTYIIVGAIAVLVIGGVIMYTSRGSSTPAGTTPTTPAVTTIPQLQSSITSLTNTVNDVSDRLANLETRVNGLAAPEVTKADIDSLKASIDSLSSLTGNWTELNITLANITDRLDALENVSITTSEISVKTENYSVVASTVMVLEGSFNTTISNGTFYVWFEYGTSTSYGYTTPSQQLVVTSIRNVAFTSLIAGLSQGHFRACASNSIETVYGKDMSFNISSTPSPSPNITTTTWTPAVFTTPTTNLSASIASGSMSIKNADSYIIKISVTNAGDNATTGYLILDLAPINLVAVSNNTTFWGQTKPYNWVTTLYGGTSSCSLIESISESFIIPPGDSTINIGFNLVYGS